MFEVHCRAEFFGEILRESFVIIFLFNIYNINTENVNASKFLVSNGVLSRPRLQLFPRELPLEGQGHAFTALRTKYTAIAEYEDANNIDGHGVKLRICAS